MILANMVIQDLYVKIVKIIKDFMKVVIWCVTNVKIHMLFLLLNFCRH